MNSSQERYKRHVNYMPPRGVLLPPLSFYVFDFGYDLLFPSLGILLSSERPRALKHVLLCRKEHLEKNRMPKTIQETTDIPHLFHLIDNDMFSPISGFWKPYWANFFILPLLTSLSYNLLTTQVPDECFINMHHVMSLCFYPLIDSHHTQNKALGFPTLSLPSSMLFDFRAPLWSLSITFH